MKEHISIHSLRVEGDRAASSQCRRRAQFQSTPSVWRETCDTVHIALFLKISIHSLRVEGDSKIAQLSA